MVEPRQPVHEAVCGIKVPMPTSAENPPDQRVWMMRVHRRVSLRQAHAVVSIDWNTLLAHTSCGLGLRPDELTDVPMRGCMPCEFCVAATPRPPEIEP